MGIVAEEDQAPIGLGLISWGDEDRAWLSLEVTPALRARRFVLHRVGKALVAAARKGGEPLYALQDPDEPTSAPWLTRLGFAPSGEIYRGEKVWHNLHS